MVAIFYNFSIIFYLLVLIRQNSYIKEFNFLVNEADKWKIKPKASFSTFLQLGKKCNIFKKFDFYRYRI